MTRPHREPEIVKDLETQKAWEDDSWQACRVFYLHSDGLVRWGVI